MTIQKVYDKLSMTQ